MDFYDAIMSDGTLANTLKGGHIYNVFYIATFIIVGIVAVVYYLVLNHPRLNRWFHWLVANVIASLGTAIFVYLRAKDTVMNARVSEKVSINEYIILVVIAFVSAFVIFTLVSLLIKWVSTNCKYSPF